MNPKVAEVELFAWLGEDEFGSGEVGLKQAMVPAGMIPMVAVSEAKMRKYWAQAEELAKMSGKRIHLCRFTLVEVLRETEAGT